MPDGAPLNLPKLMNDPTTEPVCVLFYERAKVGYRGLYTHTFPKRKTIASVYEDVAEGYEMARDHANTFQCPADVYQGQSGPFGHILLEIREQSPFPVADDGWEPWQGANGHRHESYRWAD